MHQQLPFLTRGVLAVLAACRCGKPPLSPAQHLQAYVTAKVRGDTATYGRAMAALLAGLEQHKAHQAEVAAYCKVRRMRVMLCACTLLACAAADVRAGPSVAAGAGV